MLNCSCLETKNWQLPSCDCWEAEGHGFADNDDHERHHHHTNRRRLFKLYMKRTYNIEYLMENELIILHSLLHTSYINDHACTHLTDMSLQTKREEDKEHNNNHNGPAILLQ